MTSFLASLEPTRYYVNGGVRVALATAEDTILAKLEWAAIGGSERQLRDVMAILRAQRNALDLSYLQRWSADLGVDAALFELLDNLADETGGRLS